MAEAVQVRAAGDVLGWVVDVQVVRPVQGAAVAEAMQVHWVEAMQVRWVEAMQAVVGGMVGVQVVVSVQGATVAEEMLTQLVEAMGDLHWHSSKHDMVDYWRCRWRRWCWC